MNIAATSHNSPMHLNAGGRHVAFQISPFRRQIGTIMPGYHFGTSWKQSGRCLFPSGARGCSFWLERPQDHPCECLWQLGLGARILSAVGDYNGDGKVDISFYDAPDKMFVVMLNNSDGTFRQINNNTQGWGDWSKARFFSTGDFNGDGMTDWSWYAPWSNDFIVMLSNGSCDCDVPRWILRVSPLAACHDCRDSSFLDVGQASFVACLLVGQGSRKPRKEVRGFSTMTSGLLALREWLRSQGYTQVGMESTVVYWEPTYNILDGHFNLVLDNAQHMKNVPGRKTDVKDSEWGADLLRHGLIRFARASCSRGHSGSCTS
jgi:hypothetical protein